MTELPVNCLFDKTITGCGGTELALTNGKHTIIAMPFVNLVDNKVNQEQQFSNCFVFESDANKTFFIKSIFS